MQRILQVVATVALLLLSLVLWDAHQLIRDARVSLRLTDPVLGNINAAAGDVRTVAQSTNAALLAEAKQLDASTDELRKTERAARKLIDYTNRNLNDGLLPKANEVLDSAKVSIDALQPSLAATAQATQRLDDILASPVIPATFESLQASATNLAAATGNATKVTADASATMADVRTGVHYELQELMKPVNKVYSAAKIVATLLGKFLGY